MDLDPRLSFCAIFSSKLPTYCNILDLDMKLVQTFPEHQMVEFSRRLGPTMAWQSFSLPGAPGEYLSSV